MKYNNWVNKIGCALFFFCIAISTNAQKFVKTTSTGNGSGSDWDNALGGMSGIASAISSGQNVYIAAGTYTATSNYPLTFTTSSSALIQGGFPSSNTGTNISNYDFSANPTIFSGGGNGGTNSNNTVGFGIIKNTGKTNLELKGLIFQNMYSATDNGLAYSCASAMTGSALNFKFRDLIIRYSNTGGSAAGIYLFGCGSNSSSISIVNVTFQTIKSTSNGGSINITGSSTTIGSVNIDSSRFIGSQSSGLGGAIHMSTLPGTSSIANSDFTATSATQNGGAIYIAANSGGTSLTNVSIASCSSSQNGGGFYIAACTGAISLNTLSVSNCTAGASGGGGSVFSCQGGLIVGNCCFNSNTSTTFGGGLALNSISGATNTLSLVKFFNNNSSQWGGALFNGTSSTTLSISNSIFVKNASPSTHIGGAIFNQNASITMNNCGFSGNKYGTSTTAAGSDITGGTYNATSCKMQLTNAASYTTATLTGTGNTFLASSSGSGCSAIIIPPPSPGGVSSGLKLWLKADAGVTPSTDSGAVTAWNDQSGNAYHLTSIGGTAPRIYTTSKTNLINFNPSIKFLGNGSIYRIASLFPQTSPYAFGGVVIDEKTAANTFGCIFEGSTNWSFTLHKGYGSPSRNGWVIYRDGDNYLNNGPTSVNSIGGNGFSPSGGSNGAWNGSTYSANNIGTQPQAFVLTDANTTGTTETHFIDGYKTVTTGLTVSNRAAQWFQLISLGGYTNAAFPMTGRIPEFFAYNQNLSDIDVQKINSYLAIKYGITLGQGGLNASTNINRNHNNYNYLASNGTVVWTGSTATYNSNIFGIALDNSSGLYQKQSNSADSGLQPIIGQGSSLANSNEANFNAFTASDTSFFLAGSDNGLDSFGTPTSRIRGINYRLNRIWRVQRTNHSDTVVIAWPTINTTTKLLVSTDNVFNSSDSAINTTTVVINGTSYQMAKVSAVQLASGSYFTFGALVSMPGGVPGAIIWTRADLGTNTTTNLDSISSWINYGSGGGTFTRLGTTVRPKYTTNFVNFNPAVGYYSLCGGCGLKNAGVNPAGKGKNSLLTSYAVNIRDGWPYGYVPTITFPNGRETFIDENYASLANLDATRWYLYAHGPSANLITVPTQLANKPYISSLNFPAVGQKAYSTHNGFLGLSASSVDTSFYVGRDANLFAEGRSIGTGAGYHHSYGHMTEVVAFIKTLTSAERNRLESYLAVKYGITLLNDLGTSTRNYLSSWGSTIWNASATTSFNNNVFGVGRDDFTALNQRVSNTVNTITAAKLIVASNNNYTWRNDTSMRTSFTKDSVYQIYGDNNNNSTTLIDLDTNSCPALKGNSKRIAKKWRVQTTGDQDATWISADLTTYSNFSSCFMMIADDSNFTVNAALVPTNSYSNGIAVVNYLFPNNAVKFITFGGVPGTPACATCRGGAYVIRQGNSWNDGTMRTNDSTGWFNVAVDADTFQIKAKNKTTYANAPGTEWVDPWMPLPYGPQALLAHAGTLNGAAGLITYTTEINKAGKVNFDLAGIGDYYGNKVKVVVKGYCGAGLVSPIITPAITGPWAVYNAFNISGNTITGSKYYHGLSDFGKVKINFNKPVEKIVIEYTVVRNPTYYTHFWLTVGDMILECESPLEPNRDNVFIKQSISPDTIAACNTASMKMTVKNLNCTSRVMNIADTLPLGLEFVPSSFSSADTNAKPTYSGRNFNLPNYTIKSGEVDMFVNVRSTNSDLVTVPTTYQTQSIYSVTVASGGTGATILSDNLSALSGIQTTDVTLKPATKPAMPSMTFKSVGSQDSCGIINYTITIDNTSVGSMTGLNVMPFINLGQIMNGSITLSSGLSGTILPTPLTGSTTFMIPDLNINTVGVHTISFTTSVTKIDEKAANYIELSLSPAANECAVAAKVTAGLNGDCPVCEGGSGRFNMKSAWYSGGATAATANTLTNILSAKPLSGKVTATATVTYPNASVEYYPTYFPRWNGSFTEISRYDNLSGAAGLVKYTVSFKDSSGTPIGVQPSFQLAGMTKEWNQTDVVKVTGYCGAKMYTPKLNLVNNYYPTYYNRYTVSGNVATGTQPYYDNWNFAAVNVEFEKEVERIEIEWTVNRTPAYKTVGFLYISDINMICKERPEPNPDGVHVLTSFLKDSLPTCEDATLKINIKNWNCDPKQIDIASTLPSGLVYVDSSYSGFGTAQPTFSGQNFALNNILVPSGNSFIYIKVRPSANTTASYSIRYTYSLDTGVNIPNPYRSDIPAGDTGYQDVKLYYTASTKLSPKPTLTMTADKACFEMGSDTVKYTITFNNATGSALTNVEFKNMLNNQKYIDGISGSPLGGNIDVLDSLQILLSNLTIPVGKSSISYRAFINDTTKSVSNNANILVNPSSECAFANQSYSNTLTLDSAFYYTGLTTGSPKASDIGITTLDRNLNLNWPKGLPNAWVTLHSRTKGFVITRTTSTAITTPIEGMLIYDTTDKCMKLYNGTIWKCIERQCAE